MTLPLDARQRAMLAAMGVKVWQPPAQSRVIAPQGLATAPITTPAPAPAPLAAPTVALKALPDGLADMDWASLAAAAAQCQACGLCETRQHSVFASGTSALSTTQTPWLFITDPPNTEEESAGQLLLHSEGELFEAMLQALGLAWEPSQVSVVPVLKCRVPDQRNPQPQELQQCRAFLARQVGLRQPQVIVAMGRWAVQSVLSAHAPDIAVQPLGKLRGQVYRFADTPVIVTYHPRSLLHTPLDKAKAWADLCLAHSLTRRP